MGWSFVGGDTKRVTNTSATSVTLSITSPVANNLLIAGIHVRRSTPIATPSGWTLIRKYENTGSVSVNISAALFYRISDGAETGVTFSWDNAYEAACFYQEISGLATSGVLHGSDDDTTNVISSSSSGGFGSLTPTEQPGLAVIFSAYLVNSSSSSLSYNDGFSSASTGPSGGVYDPYVELGYKGYSSLSEISPSVSYSREVKNYGILALFREPAAPSSIAGSLSATLGSLAASGAGAVAVKGAASATLGALGLGASGTVSSSLATGSLTEALGGIGASGAGQIAITATLADVLGSVSLSGTGASPITAALAGLLGALPVAGAGSVAVTGEAANSLAGASLGSSGVVGSVPISGELGAALGSLAASGAASILVSGALEQSFGHLSLLAASDAMPITGALSIPLGAVTVDALGALSITGAGAVMLDAPGSLAIGSVGITGGLAEVLALIELDAASREGSPGVLEALLRLYPALDAQINTTAQMGATIRIR